MAEYAHIIDGAVFRTYDSDTPPPAHKAAYLLPVVEDKPAFDAAGERLAGPDLVIEANQVVRRWTKVSRPRDEMINRVAKERERRLRLGFSYDFGDARGVHQIATTDEDMRGWDEVTKAAQAAINAGAPATTINIVTDTGPATVTATEWQSILLAAGAARQPIWAASFAIQALDPIPADYDDDARWP